MTRLVVAMHVQPGSQATVVRMHPSPWWLEGFLRPVPSDVIAPNCHCTSKVRVSIHCRRNRAQLYSPVRVHPLDHGEQGPILPILRLR